MSRTILRRASIQSQYGIANSTQYRLIKAGLWPTPIHLGLRAVGWLEAEVNAVVSARAAGRTDDEIKKLVKDLIVGRKAVEQAALQAAGVPSPLQENAEVSTPASQAKEGKGGWCAL